MAAKFSRLLLILLTLFTASVVLPELYQTSFKRYPKSQALNYSEVSRDFLIVSGPKDPIRDTKGNEYDMAGYEKLVPCMAFRQLTKNGTMPDSLYGVALSPELIYATTYSMRMYLNERDKYFGLVSLLEGGTETVGYVNRGDFLRINLRGVEFVDAKTNSVNKSKSAMFDAELDKLGYAPPAKRFWGSNSTSKLKDDGLFFADANDNLFRVMFFAGKPLVERVALPEGMIVRRMYYAPTAGVIGYVFDTQNRMWKMNKECKLTQLPVDGFDYDNNRSIEFWGNLFFNFITVTGESAETLYVMDKTDRLVDSYTLSKPSYAESTAGLVEPFVYPFKTSKYTYVNGFDFDFIGFGWWKFIFLNLVLAAVVFRMKKSNGLNLCNPFHIIDIALVAMFGVFAFVGVIIFPIRK